MQRAWETDACAWHARAGLDPFFTRVSRALAQVHCQETNPNP